MEFKKKILVRDRVNHVPAAGDVSSPQDGDIWYNSTTNKFRKRENGVTSDIGATTAVYDLTTSTMVLRNNYWSATY